MNKELTEKTSWHEISFEYFKRLFRIKDKIELLYKLIEKLNKGELVLDDDIKINFEKQSIYIKVPNVFGHNIYKLPNTEEEYLEEWNYVNTKTIENDISKNHVINKIEFLDYFNNNFDNIFSRIFSEIDNVYNASFGFGKKFYSKISNPERAISSLDRAWSELKDNFWCEYEKFKNKARELKKYNVTNEVSYKTKHDFTIGYQSGVLRICTPSNECLGFWLDKLGCEENLYEKLLEENNRGYILFSLIVMKEFKDYVDKFIRKIESRKEKEEKEEEENRKEWLEIIRKQNYKIIQTIAEAAEENLKENEQINIWLDKSGKVYKEKINIDYDIVTPRKDELLIEYIQFGDDKELDPYYTIYPVSWVSWMWLKDDGKDVELINQPLSNYSYSAILESHTSF